MRMEATRNESLKHFLHAFARDTVADGSASHPYILIARPTTPLRNYTRIVNLYDPLELVEYPIVIDPNEKLEKIATKNGWQIADRFTITDIIKSHVNKG